MLEERSALELRNLVEAPDVVSTEGEARHRLQGRSAGVIRQGALQSDHRIDLSISWTTLWLAGINMSSIATANDPMSQVQAKFRARQHHHQEWFA